MPRRIAPPQSALDELEGTVLPPVSPPGTYRAIGEMTDKEVTDYVAFMLESVAHLQGRLGALNTHNLLGLAARTRRIGAAHNMNVRDKTNWAAGPREQGTNRITTAETTLRTKGSGTGV